MKGNVFRFFWKLNTLLAYPGVEAEFKNSQLY